jgi:hypothetical protein
MWKLESAAIAVVTGFLAQELIKLVYRVVRRDKTRDTPFDPRNARFSWLNALAWATAAGLGLGVARVLSNRVAALGWELATGTPPPADEDAVKPV